MPAKKSKKFQNYTFLKVVYIIFLALIITLFVGLGIAAFYDQPKEPQQPNIMLQADSGKYPSVEQRQAEIDFEKAMKDYRDNKLGPYNRNVSIITLIAAVVFVTVGLLFAGRFLVLSDGLLLGGVFTLIYSIIRAANANNLKFTFLIVSIGLAVTIFLGFWKFLRKPKNK